MKIKQTHEFELEVEVVRHDGDAHIILVKIDSDGGEYHTPVDIDWDIDADLEDGRCGKTIDIIPNYQIPEDWTNEQIIDSYFNSPYGVA